MTQADTINGMYAVPTDGCNIEIMGYPFYAEKVSADEAFRRRDYNTNQLVGGTAKITKGGYIGLAFSITTHIKVDPDNPNVHNTVFQEMMSKPVKVVSPEIGGSFNANVKIGVEHDKPDYLKLTIDIAEIPSKKSKIPGESFTVPATKKIDVKKKKEEENNNKNKNDNTRNNNDKKSSGNSNKGKTNNNSNKGRTNTNKRNRTTKKNK